MSVVSYRAETQPVPPIASQQLPGDSELTGEETLEFFVHEIVRRENSRRKRDNLPEIAPPELDRNPGLISRVKAKLLRAA